MRNCLWETALCYKQGSGALELRILPGTGAHEKLGAETQLTKQEPELSLKFRTGAEAIAI